MLDQNTGNLLEAFRTQAARKQLREPKQLSSGKMVPKKSIKRKVRNGLIKIYVNAILIITAAAVVFAAYRLAVLPQIFPPEPKTQAPPPPVKIDNVDYQGPATYASTFSYYWLTGDMEEAQKYFANGFELPENSIQLQKQEVDWSKIWAVNPVSKNRVNVVIQARVRPVGSENSENDNNSGKVVYLSVPMFFDNGKYGVYDIPTYLPAPGKAIYQQENKVSAPISQADGNQIRDQVWRFLDEYYGGDPGKTAVYMSDGKNRVVLKNAELDKLQVEIYAVSQNDPNRVLAEATSNVKIDGVPMIQKFKLNMVKSGKTWMIEKTDPNLPLYIPTKKENDQ